MAGVKRFEDLIAWQKARQLCLEVYRLSAGFPSDERFGLTAQARRSAVSIASNIAEGFGRQTTADLVRFLRIARGSHFEMHTQITIAVDLGYVHDDRAIESLIAECDRVIQGLIRSLEERVHA